VTQTIAGGITAKARLLMAEPMSAKPDSGDA